MLVKTPFCDLSVAICGRCRRDRAAINKTPNQAGSGRKAMSRTLVVIAAALAVLIAYPTRPVESTLRSCSAKLACGSTSNAYTFRDPKPAVPGQ